MQKYFKFSGLSTRSEYWGVQFLALFGTLALVLVLGLLGQVAYLLAAVLMFALLVGYLWILLATSVRRCRDAAINPWWVLAMLVPWAGIVVWIVVGCLKTHAQNVKTAQPQS